MIIYSKFSGNRANRFAVRTDILEENGRRFVRKTPLTGEARAYVQRIAEAGNHLSRMFEGTPFEANRCRTCGDGIEFEYLEGDTLEANLDAILEEDPEKAGEALLDYARRIEALADVPFTATDAFREVFGEADLPEGMRAFSFADIDLLPCNIIVQEGTDHVIDYEWSFDFPVPVRYILWRIVIFYIRGSSKRLILPEADLLARLSIGEEEAQCFEKMEQHFQEYIVRGAAPLWKLMGEMSPGVLHLPDFIEHVRPKTVRTPGKVYLDRGEGFSEQDTLSFAAGPDGIAEVRVPLNGLRSFRIDPADEACVVKILSEEPAGILSGSHLNGWWESSDEAVFMTDDPCFVIREIPQGTASYACTLKLDATEKTLNEAARAKLAREAHLPEEKKESRLDRMMKRFKK